MQISSSNFSDPDSGQVKPEDVSKSALHYKRDGTKVWVWNVFAHDWIQVVLSGGSGGSQTPWTSNINGGGFSLSNVANVIASGTVGVQDVTRLDDTDNTFYFKAEDAAISLYATGTGGTFKWLSIGDPEEGCTLHGNYAFHASGFGGDEFIGGIFDGTSYKVSSTQVVGARGAAVANATDAATAITQLNALLARLRTHGLIAP